MEEPMPGAMHRMGVYLGLVEDEDFVDGSDGYGHPADRGTDRGTDRAAERAPIRRDEYPEGRYSAETHHGRGVDNPAREYGDAEHYPNGNSANGFADATQTYQITALHPRTYNEARTIGESFRQNTPVIMNLSEMDDADAKRLVDFAAGLTFGLHGRLERVTAKVFLLSPHNVTVTAQDKARIENGFFNQS
jgi:cell division inhibitor SepF